MRDETTTRVAAKRRRHYRLDLLRLFSATAGHWDVPLEWLGGDVSWSS